MASPQGGAFDFLASLAFDIALAQLAHSTARPNLFLVFFRHNSTGTESAFYFNSIDYCGNGRS
jgi:hypothetical protein